MGPVHSAHQILNYASTFNYAAFAAAQTSKTYVNAPAGLAFPGDPGFPGQSDTFPRYLDFAPRVGVVWDARGKGRETIRAGYGIFYDSSYLWNTLHVPLNAPWANTITLNAPPGGLSNPWQGYPGGNPFPTAVNPPNTPTPLTFNSGTFRCRGRPVRTGCFPPRTWATRPRTSG